MAFELRPPLDMLDDSSVTITKQIIVDLPRGKP